MVRPVPPDVPGSRSERGGGGCARCARWPGPPCRGCARRLEPAPLLALPAGIDALGAVFAYRGVGADLVAGWKFGGDRRATGRFTSAMAAVAPAGPHDVVTWAPTGADRVRGRGYDPAELLARGVAARTGLACRSLLVRLEGPAQTGRSAHDRRAVTGFAPRARPPRRVLVVDDVCTTGATLAAAAAVLRASGATAVDAVVLARTPP